MLWYNTLMNNNVIFSGIQPTGTPHIGNYFGALKQWVALQKEGDCIFCVVDLHALTVKQNPKAFAQKTLETAVDLIALGVDPARSTLFVQSCVPEHVELSWFFATLTPIAELGRMTQYKEKSTEHTSNINAGLLTYPILMAADILLYKALSVPVGEDQVQHVELARVIARKFNNAYGDTFPEPKPKLTKSARIMSLTDPEKKMSKSHGEKTFIALTDDTATIEQKLSRAVTATSGGGKNPGVENLLTLLREVSDAVIIKMYEDAEKDGSIRYADLKRQLAKDLADHLAPFRKRRAELMRQPAKVGEILEAGRKQAAEIAARTMEEVRAKIGLWR